MIQNTEKEMIGINAINSTDNKEINLSTTDPQEQQTLEKIFTLLLKQTGVDFSHYRDTTILRRLSRRISLNKLDNFQNYLNYLKKTSKEIELLYNDLLLSFTEFFRDENIFTILKEKIFTKIIEKRTPGIPIRIWVAGCSTGEEVYSLAICFFEFLEKIKSNATVQLFGTDLVEKNIIKARMGIYPNKIRKNISKERLEQFFEETPHGLKVNQQIRQMCIFGIQNITQDPPFPNIDLVSCRNVLIYFDTAFQEIAIPLFHFSLKPNGYLLLGSSETMGRFPQYFNILDAKINLYTKRTSGTRPSYRHAFKQAFSNFKETKNKMNVKNTPKRNSIEITHQINDIILDTYTPPGVLIDSNLQIRHFIGNITPFLIPAEGEASLNLTKMAGEGLMPDLYVAIEEVKKKKHKIRKKNITFKQNKKTITTDICIIPVPDTTSSEINFLILFETLSIQQPSQKNNSTNNNNEEFYNLKHELQATKEHLQFIVEEKDEVNQSLWSANEEILSTNEELQSMNEEMETAKEELESGNEELISLNEELQEKNIELTTAKEFAENILETANTIVMTLDIDGNIKTFNKFAEKLTGYDKDKVINKNFIKMFIAHENRNIVNKILKKILSDTQKTSQYENAIITKSGDVKTTSWSNSLLMNNSGLISGILCIGMDITEQKKGQAKLKENEQHFRTYFEQGLIGMTITSIDKKMLEINDYFCNMLGYSQEELCKMNWSEFTYPADLETDLKQFNQLISGKKNAYTLEKRFVHKNGDVVYTIISVNLQQNAETSEKYCLTLVQDITEQKKAEAKLKESEEYFRTLITNNNNAILIIDKKGNNMFQNKSYEKIMGYDSEERKGKSVFEYIYPDDKEIVIKQFKSIVQNHKSIDNLKFRAVHKDGSIRYLEGSAKNMLNSSIISGILINYRDVTNQKRTEEELQKIDKLKSIGTLAGGIAHDFNNILGGIYGNISLAKLKLSQNKSGIEFIEKAEQSMDRAVNLTKQLLTFSKGGAPVKENISLSELITEIVTFDLSGSNIKPIFKQTDNLWHAEVDKGQIEQVFSNLTINANQATPNGGHLYITMKNTTIAENEIVNVKKGKYIKISFQDEGIGISKENLTKIFDPYFTTKQAGSGLGLATTYSIIKKHNGHIDISSKLGTGTTFTIYLPAAKFQNNKKKIAVKTVAAITNKSAKILVMDDEEVICTIVSEMVGTIGFSAETALNGEEAIEKYQKSLDNKTPFDLIIMDLTIPGGMGGKEAIKHILKINAKAKVIVTSGYSGDPIMANYKDYGFKGIITKPYMIDKLKDTLLGVLEADD